MSTVITKVRHVTDLNLSNIRKASIINNLVMDTPPSVLSRKRKTMQEESLEGPIGLLNLMGSPIGFVTSTPVIQENDDKAERRNWKRVSTLQEDPGSTKTMESISLNTLEEYLRTWVRMSAENKINAKNVWKIHIIDYLKILMDKNTENSLQLATVSLAASAKVYSLRVDDAHTEVMRLAVSLRHLGNNNKDNVNEDVDGNQPGDHAEGAEDTFKIRNRKNKKSKNKTIMNTEALVGNVDLLDTAHSIFAELNTRNGDIIGTDNMFQIFAPLNSQKSEYDIRINEMFFDCTTMKRTDAVAMELSEDVKKIVLPFTLSSPGTIDSLRICSTFSEFSHTTWSLNEEESLNIQQTQTTVVSINDRINLAFDLNAEPQEITDLAIEEFENHPNYSSDEELVQEANIDSNLPTIISTRCMPKIENIVDIRPSHSNHTRNLEYSYNSIASGIWTGPAHWKIKSIVHRTQPRMTNTMQQTTRKKKSKLNMVEILYVELSVEEQLSLEEQFFKCSDNKLKMKTLYVWNKNKYELPIDLHVTCTDILKLFLNKSWSLVHQQRPASILAIKKNQYDYNFNDSEFYTSPIPDILEKSNDIQHAYSDHETDDRFTNVDHGKVGDIMLTGDNLLRAPRVIPKLFVPYTTRAKKVNMKTIKQTMWGIITKSIGDENNENVNILNKEVNKENTTETKFSKVIEKLPELLPRDQAKNISVSLGFFGLLHLANEKTLKLMGNDLTDVTINKG